MCFFRDVTKYIDDNKLKPAAPEAFKPPDGAAAGSGKPAKSKPSPSAIAPPKRGPNGENPFVDKEINTMRRVTAERLTESKVQNFLGF